MPIITAALKTEITTDPGVRGYMALASANDFQGAANLINAINPAITVRRIDIDASEVLEAVDTADFQTVPPASAGAVAWFESVTQAAQLRLVADDGTDTRILKGLKQLFLPNGAAGAAPQTRARLQAMSVRPGSRAEQLWGAGTTVSGSDIANALVS